MKPNKLFKLCTAVLCFVLSAGCLSFAACNPEEPPAHTHTFESGWTYDADSHWHKATCEHATEVSGKAAHTFSGNECTVCHYTKPQEVDPNAAKCDIKCPVCGRCIDVDCTLDAVKCGDGLTSHKLEAEESIYGESPTMGEEGNRWRPALTKIRKPENRNECFFVASGIMGNAGASLTFKFTVSKATTATLRIRCCKNRVRNVYTESMLTMVNGEMIERDAMNALPLTDNPYTEEPNDALDRKDDFAFINLGCISLNEGENTIVLTVATADSEKGYHHDFIELLTDSSTVIKWKPTDNSDAATGLSEFVYVYPHEPDEEVTV